MAASIEVLEDALRIEVLLPCSWWKRRNAFFQYWARKRRCSWRRN